MAQSVITRRIVVAGGVFAPGHLGELTRIVPFEMAGAVLCPQRAYMNSLKSASATASMATSVIR